MRLRNLPSMKDGRVAVYVWTDFVCPYCLLAEDLIKDSIKGEAVELIWMPFELRPFPTPTLRPGDDYLSQAWARGVYPFAASLGVDIRLPTVSPQPYTRLAFLGMQFAADQGLQDQYVDAVLRAFFQQDLDIGNVDVLKAIVVELGMELPAFEASLLSQEYARRHDNALALAHQIGINSVPTILVGDRFLNGARDRASFKRAITAVKEQHRLKTIGHP